MRQTQEAIGASVRPSGFQTRLLKKEVNTAVSALIWKIRGILSREEGQGMVEYALILVLVSIVVILVLTLMGGQIRNTFQDVTNALVA